MPLLTDRKVDFKIALARSGMTASRFARQYGCSRTHLYRVLREPAESRVLSQHIDAFIAQYAPSPTGRAA